MKLVLTVLNSKRLQLYIHTTEVVLAIEMLGRAQRLGGTSNEDVQEDNGCPVSFYNNYYE
jgi:hypothetical protein